ncbi:hypothetical protein VNO78_15706 [Psophocarpus tetragonolobus]|uniref:Pentatricopeptide repeat-containing protein n=1 Tax=Psophocarpus tetragonolobus TaxID=3891 RepID=A0AAN9SF21_PSOTE
MFKPCSKDMTPIDDIGVTTKSSVGMYIVGPSAYPLVLPVSDMADVLTFKPELSRSVFSHFHHFIQAFLALSRTFVLPHGMQIHKELINSGFVLDNFISSSLVKMYGKCGHLEMAIEVFEQISKKTIVTWNSMISGYGLKSDNISCIKLLKRMYKEGVMPTLTTLNVAQGKLFEAFGIFGEMRKSYVESDAITFTSAYEALGAENARTLIDKDPDDS